MTDLPRLRTGRHLANHLYVQTGAIPVEHADPGAGSMHTPELGALVVRAVNAWLDEHPEDRAVLASFRAAHHDEGAVLK